MRISIEGVVSQLMNQGFKSAVGRRRGADLTPKCKGSNPAAPASQSVSNASHMKVAQKPRGTARFRRYELVSVCGGVRPYARLACPLDGFSMSGTL
jgi:hypothetical protein